MHFEDVLTTQIDRTIKMNDFDTNKCKNGYEMKYWTTSNLLGRVQCISTAKSYFFENENNYFSITGDCLALET